MSYKIQVSVYKIKDNINLPLASNPQEIANSSIGDLIICFGGDVYAQEWNNDNTQGNFVLLLNDIDFINANEQLFENICR